MQIFPCVLQQGAPLLYLAKAAHKFLYNISNQILQHLAHQLITNQSTMKLTAFVPSLFLTFISSAAAGFTSNPFGYCLKACTVRHQGDNNAIDDCVSNCKLFKNKEGEESLTFVAESSAYNRAENLLELEDPSAEVGDTIVALSQSRSECLDGCDEFCQEVGSEISDAKCDDFRRFCYSIICNRRTDHGKDLSEDAKHTKLKKIATIGCTEECDLKSADNTQCYDRCACIDGCDRACEDLGPNCGGTIFRVLCYHQCSKSMNRDADKLPQDTAAEVEGTSADATSRKGLRKRTINLLTTL